MPNDMSVSSLNPPSSTSKSAQSGPTLPASALKQSAPTEISGDWAGGKKFSVPKASSSNSSSQSNGGFLNNISKDVDTAVDLLQKLKLVRRGDGSLHVANNLLTEATKEKIIGAGSTIDSLNKQLLDYQDKANKGTLTAEEKTKAQLFAIRVKDIITMLNLVMSSLSATATLGRGVG
ncbi:hypothetical protein [Noviherbaspirillum humi]|uniref:hypothetical protein n=1 Tax=Noviherbaspirillum humi TaxID=1688639 RepID=UPI00116090C6|nr:hypothetical protein [Noviherbaspirillum humi]